MPIVSNMYQEFSGQHYKHVSQTIHQLILFRPLQKDKNTVNTRNLLDGERKFGISGGKNADKTTQQTNYHQKQLKVFALNMTM